MRVDYDGRSGHIDSRGHGVLPARSSLCRSVTLNLSRKRRAPPSREGRAPSPLPPKPLGSRSPGTEDRSPWGGDGVGRGLSVRARACLGLHESWRASCPRVDCLVLGLDVSLLRAALSLSTCAAPSWLSLRTPLPGNTDGGAVPAMPLPGQEAGAGHSPPSHSSRHISGDTVAFEGLCVLRGGGPAPRSLLLPAGPWLVPKTMLPNLRRAGWAPHLRLVISLLFILS